MAIGNIQQSQYQVPSITAEPRKIPRNENGEIVYTPEFKEGLSKITQKYSFFPSEESMQTVLAAQEKGFTPSSINPFATRVASAEKPISFEDRGAAWKGYTVQPFNGTYQISPVVADREDSIEDCPWEEYYA